jgi:hypothetical protein
MSSLVRAPPADFFPGFMGFEKLQRVELLDAPLKSLLVVLGLHGIPKSNCS